jgi:carboxymethylenebutenolidase
MQVSQGWATAKLQKSPRHQEWVQITKGSRALKAWVEYPEARKAPVVLVLHEVFGLTDSTRNTADQISAMGFVVVVPDMLSGLAANGGGTSEFPDSRTASGTLTGLEDSFVNADLDTWADYAARMPRSNGKLAIVGLSWGGGAAFRYASTPRPDVKAVFVFYDVGPPTVTQGPGRGLGTGSFPVAGIRVPVHGFYPDKDARVMGSLEATKAAMAAAGKSFDAVIYPGAEHAYMRVGEDPDDHNPANASAVKESLARLKKQLGEALR